MKTFRLMMMMMMMMVISFLLFATRSGVVAEGNDVVYDADGEPVKANVPYYISFMTSDYGMWICRLNMRSSDNPKSSSSCPQQPVMFTNPDIAPTPVMFLLSTSDMVVHESTELNIKFVNPGHCFESGIWRVVKNNSTLEGEVVLNGSKSCDDSTFTIHKTNEFYMFTIGDATFDPTTISLSNEPGGKSRLIAKRFSGEMEVYFYRSMPF